jgi:hypothetical protein
MLIDEVVLERPRTLLLSSRLVMQNMAKAVTRISVYNAGIVFIRL